MQCNLLEEQNPRLQDENPQQAEVLQLERELEGTRHENVQLSRTIVTIEAKLKEQEEWTGTRTDKVERSVENLTEAKVQLDAIDDGGTHGRETRGSTGYE